jgi:hypothetical protein
MASSNQRWLAPPCPAHEDSKALFEARRQIMQLGLALASAKLETQV